MRLLSKFADWFVRSVLRVEDLHWIEKPNAFVKELKTILANDERSGLHDVHLQCNNVKGQVSFRGVATMTLCDGELEFQDVVYINGRLTRGVCMVSLRCDAIYHGIIPNVTHFMVLDNKVFDGVVQLAARFKRDLDLLHSRQSRISEKR